MIADTDGNPKVFTRNDGTCGAKFEVTAHTVRFLQGGRQEQEREQEPGQEALPF